MTVNSVLVGLILVGILLWFWFEQQIRNS